MPLEADLKINVVGILVGAVMIDALVVTARPALDLLGVVLRDSKSGSAIEAGAAFLTWGLVVVAGSYVAARSAEIGSLKQALAHALPAWALGRLLSEASLGGVTEHLYAYADDVLPNALTRESGFELIGLLLAMAGARLAVRPAISNEEVSGSHLRLTLRVPTVTASFRRRFPEDSMDS